MTPAQTTRQRDMAAAAAGAAVLSLLLVALGGARAASDGWTPIIPEGAPSAGRHSLAVEPGLPGPSSLAAGLPAGLASSLASLSSLGGSSYHSHVDHHVDHHVAFRPGPPSPRPITLHMPLPSPLPSALPDFGLHSAHGAHGAHGAHHDHGDTCALYKAAMTQDLYFQYIQYKVHMPDLKEFTLCMWHKFYNHSSDHPLFSYATRETPRAILSWVSATDRSTYFSASVDGHTLYRLNYPLRLNRWYHSCQSWNGRTGEWQVWVNAERVGRGFHNLLVNHVIKGGGVAITGQEQRQYGGGFIEGEGAPKGSGGMLGEITQLQMYTVALTAGKAYRDHKHHHGNYNGVVDGPRSTTTTPAPMPETSTANPYAPFITNGQLTPELPIFELSAFRKNIPMPPMDDAQGSQGAASAAQPSAPSAPAMLDLSQLLAASAPASGPAVSYLHMSPGPGGASVRIPLLTHSPGRPALDLDPQQHYLFKRDDAASGAAGAAGEAAQPVEPAEDGKQEVPAAAAAATTKVKRSAEDDADKAAAQAAEMEPQKLSAKAARAVRPTKRDSKRGKTRKQPATPTEAAPAAPAAPTTRAAPAAPQPAAEADVRPSSPTKRELDAAESEQQAKQADTKKKRQTISLHGGAVDLGGDIDTSLLSQGLSGLLPHGELLGAGAPSPGPMFLELIGHGGHGGHPQLLQARPPHSSPKPPQLKKENEPAEGEVMAVMAMCSGCASDPFAKVNIISWQGTPKKLYSGVHYLPAKPVCRKF